MPYFEPKVIEAAVQETAAMYEKLSREADTDMRRMFYGLMAKLSPELTRWALSNNDQQLSDRIEVFESVMAALAASIIQNTYTDPQDRKDAIVAIFTRAAAQVQGMIAQHTPVREIHSTNG